MVDIDALKGRWIKANDMEAAQIVGSVLIETYSDISGKPTGQCLKLIVLHTSGMIGTRGVSGLMTYSENPFDKPRPAAPVSS